MFNKDFFQIILYFFRTEFQKTEKNCMKSYKMWKHFTGEKQIAYSSFGNIYVSI